jgi:hypothetical protein
MPKIFLIKNRLHQQQLRLLESQNLIQAKNENRLNIGDSSHQEQDDREPLSLVAKKRNTEDNSASTQQTADDQQKRNDSGEDSQCSIATFATDPRLSPHLCTYLILSAPIFRFSPKLGSKPRHTGQFAVFLESRKNLHCARFFIVSRRFDGA